MVKYHYITIYMHNVLNTHFLNVFYQEKVWIETFLHLSFVCQCFLTNSAKTRHWEAKLIIPSDSRDECVVFPYLNFKIHIELSQLKPCTLTWFCQHWWPFCNIIFTLPGTMVNILITITLVWQMLHSTIPNNKRRLYPEILHFDWLGARESRSK